LDDLQRAAVAEVVHAAGGTFHAARFRAKYGRDPAWGSLNAYKRDKGPTPLRLFIHGHGVLPDDLKERLAAFVPAPARAEVKTAARLPDAYERSFVHWDYRTREREDRVEMIPLKVHETEGRARRELLAVLRLEYAATLGLIDVALYPPAGARPDYGRMWGTDELLYFSRYDGLMFLRVNPLGAYCLGLAPDYKPAPLEVRPVLRVLPNLEIAAIGEDAEQGDRLALDAYAERIADRVWQLDGARLLQAVEQGRPIAEVRAFLEARMAFETRVCSSPHWLNRRPPLAADSSTRVCLPWRLSTCFTSCVTTPSSTATSALASLWFPVRLLKHVKLLDNLLVVLDHRLVCLGRGLLLLEQ